MWYKIKKEYLWWPTTIVVSDMQWPAPDGFHIPLNSEWQSIYDAYTGLGLSWGTDFSTYLKMPMAGYRNSGNVYEVGYNGYYWSSYPLTSSVYNAYSIDFNSSSVTPQGYHSRSSGFLVRCLKNTPTIPTSSWTVLYQWSWDAWIYHNPTDWLISISSDWTTRYTLMDKNLWATTVYNYWDTLTVANTGNTFQRWNNYPFPSTSSSESITTSSAQVNVTWYWPWNYYSSSTWVVKNPRQSSANNWNNLRWWVSQGTSTKTVYQQIRPKQ